MHARLHAEVAQRRHRRDHRGRARHVGLHRLHAAGGLERQAAGVEHDALADQRQRLACAPRGSYASRRKRGGALGADADADHAAEPLALELLAAPARARVSPLARASARASFTTVSGDFASAGSFTRSRAHTTACAMRAPRASPSRTFALACPSTCTRASREGLASDL